MHVFYLVRHALATWSEDDDRPLSSKGLRDARKVTEFLGERLITNIYSSPSTRAHQTVEPLARQLGLPICTDERLCERELGQWSAASFEAAVHRTWMDMDFAFTGGETNHQAQARAVRWLQELLERGSQGHILVATHGNLLALLLKHFDSSVDYEFWRALSMPDIYWLEVEAGGEGRFERLWSVSGR